MLEPAVLSVRCLHVDERVPPLHRLEGADQAARGVRHNVENLREVVGWSALQATTNGDEHQQGKTDAPHSRSDQEKLFGATASESRKLRMQASNPAK
eukprot:3199122-Pleurochrysis_carterae.AAC.2